MNPQLQRIQQAAEPLRQQIIGHQAYNVIHTLEDLNVFMQYHVFAVWDFMSLLKALQNQLTCTTVPWFPKGDAETRHLINEIVVGEESDEDENGERISHFELYLRAMQQSGADTSSIEVFLRVLQRSGDFEQAFSEAGTPPAVRDFVRFTFDTIYSEKAHVQAAVFTFGREDLIPGMFVALVRDIHTKFPESVSLFKYYLERHIEVDGDHHSHLALQMTANLCGNDEAKWKEAEEATLASLNKRIGLWNGVSEALKQKASLTA